MYMACVTDKQTKLTKEKPKQIKIKPQVTLNKVKPIQIKPKQTVSETNANLNAISSVKKVAVKINPIKAPVKIQPRVPLKKKAPIEIPVLDSDSDSDSDSEIITSLRYEHDIPCMDDTYVLPVYGVKLRMSKNNNKYIYDIDCQHLVGTIGLDGKVKWEDLDEDN